LKELDFTVLLIIKIENGEFYLYKSFSSEFNFRYTLGYSFSFSRILYEWPLFKVPPSKEPLPSKKSMDTTNPENIVDESTEKLSAVKFKVQLFTL
jgi:hypothetical protein